MLQEVSHYPAYVRMLCVDTQAASIFCLTCALHVACICKLKHSGQPVRFLTKHTYSLQKSVDIFDLSLQFCSAKLRNAASEHAETQ